MCEELKAFFSVGTRRFSGLAANSCGVVSVLNGLLIERSAMLLLNLCSFIEAGGLDHAPFDPTDGA